MAWVWEDNFLIRSGKLRIGFSPNIYQIYLSSSLGLKKNPSGSDQKIPSSKPDLLIIDYGSKVLLRSGLVTVHLCFKSIELLSMAIIITTLLFPPFQFTLFCEVRKFLDPFLCLPFVY